MFLSSSSLSCLCGEFASRLTSQTCYEGPAILTSVFSPLLSSSSSSLVRLQARQPLQRVVSMPIVTNSTTQISEYESLRWREPWSVLAAPLMDILVVRIRQVEFNCYSANWWLNVVRVNICFYDLQEDGLCWFLAQGAFVCCFFVAQRFLSSHHDDGG